MRETNSTENADAVIAKTRWGSVLEASEISDLAEAFSTFSDIRAGETVVAQGSSIQACRLILDGFFIRHKDVATTRQVTAVLIPGDLCDVHGMFFPRLDYSVTALTVGKIALAEVARLVDLMGSRPALSRFFWQSSLTEAAIEREWVFNVGRRTRVEQVAHLISEVLTRFELSGSTDRDDIVLPLTESMLAQSIARPLAEVRQAVASLVEDDLLERRGEGLSVRDFAGLKRAGAFEPDYLATG